MLLFSNNAVSTLQAALILGATTLQVAPADAALFPQPSAGNDYFMLTLEDTSQVPPLREIVRCTARVGNLMTVLRGQEGTAPAAFAAGVTVSLRLTAGSLNALAQSAGEATQLYLGAFAQPPTTTNSGGALVAGLLYFDTTQNRMFEFSGVAWAPLAGGTSTASAGLYVGAYPVAPTDRADGSALQPGDLYYNTTAGAGGGLYEYINGAWAPATISTTITGSTTVGGDLTVDGNLTVIKHSTLDAGLTVTGGETVDTSTIGTLDVTGLANVGTLEIAGKPVVEAGDLSGSANSQNWPNGNIEYWGSMVTDNTGQIDVVFPTPFPNAIYNVQATIQGNLSSGPCMIIVEEKTVEGFTVHSYSANAAAYGPVAFDWVAKGS